MPLVLQMTSEKDSSRATVFDPSAIGMSTVDPGLSSHPFNMMEVLEIEKCVGNGLDSSDNIVLNIRNIGTEDVKLFIPKGTVFEQAQHTGKQ